MEALDRGLLTGHPINGCRFVLEDGAAHVQDSSELAFRLAALGAFKEAFHRATPVILEPIMKVEVVAPIEFQGESTAFQFDSDRCTDNPSCSRHRYRRAKSAQGHDRRH